MDWLKFINNHQNDFDKPAIPFFIAYCTLMINLTTELLNIFMLLYQHTIEHAIIHFVALEVIIEIPHFYSSALIDDKLKDKVFSKTHHLHKHNKGKDINFWKDRSLFNKWGRLSYIVFRVIYVVLIFYLQPFFVVGLYSTFKKGFTPANH